MLLPLPSQRSVFKLLRSARCVVRHFAARSSFGMLRAALANLETRSYAGLRVVAHWLSPPSVSVKLRNVALMLRRNPIVPVLN